MSSGGDNPAVPFGGSRGNRPSLLLLASRIVPALLSSFLAAQEPPVNTPALPEPARLRLLVPYESSAPKIDGHVSDKEWADSVGLVGLHETRTGRFADPAFQCFVKSDGTSLFFAFRTKVDTTEMLVQKQTKRDSAVYDDDSWELYVYPEVDGNDYYQIVFNSLGTVFDQHQNDPRWNATLELEQSFGAREQGGATAWHAELSVPLRELGLTGKLEGKEFGFAVFRNQKHPAVTAFSLTAQTGLFAQPQKAAVLRFAPWGKCIGIRSLGNPLAGEILPELVFGNTPQDTQLLLALPSGEKSVQTISSGAGAVRFPPLLQGKGLALLQILSPPGAEPAQADFCYSTVVEYDTVPLVLEPVNYPSRQELQIDLGFATFARQDQVTQYLVEVGGGSRTYPRTSAAGKERIAVPTKDLGAGGYTVSVTLLGADGARLVTQAFAYTKEGGEPWRDNTIGIEKGLVPPPFTPMEIEGRNVKVVGREIALAPTGLPMAIRSQGVELLTSPVTLAGIIDGKPATLTAAAPFTFAAVGPDDSSGTAAVSLGPLRGTLKQTVSFDGFCWFEIVLAGAAGVTAQQVTLDIRLPKGVAQSHQFAGMDFAKAGVVWEETTDVLTRDWQLPFLAHLWLGNTDVGLAWIAEDHRGWQVAQDSRVMEIIREPEDVLLRANIVDEPIGLTHELRLAFGLQASPVKPVSQRAQRLLTINFVDGLVYPYMSDIPHSEVFCLYEGHRSYRGNFEAYAGLPEPAWPEVCKRTVEDELKLGVHCVPYSTLVALSMGLPDFKVYRGDWDAGAVWAGTAGSAADPAPFTECNTESKTYQDFVVWRFFQNREAFGGTAVYYDLFAPPTGVSGSGTGFRFTDQQKYVTRSGETAYPTLVRSFREIARRLYIAYKEKNPEFVIYANGGGGFYLPLISFLDAVIGQHTVHATRYPELLTYERFRSSYYGYPLGVKTFFMPHHADVLYDRKDQANYLNGITLNHNNPMWLSFVDYTVVVPYWRVYYQGDWGNQVFLPWWKYPNLTGLPAAEFKVSGWFNQKTRQGLLCIASLQGEPASARIALGRDWTFNAGALLTDACKAALGTRVYSFPNKAGRVGLEGGYAELLQAEKIGAVLNDGVGEFRPYGVLMLSVK
jgi:hypothetical protein